MTRTATPKLKTFVALAGLSVFAAIASGRVELLAFAAPLLVAATVAALATPEPDIEVDIKPSLTRLIEGDELAVEVTLTPKGSWPEAALALSIPYSFHLLEPAQPVVITLDAGRPATQVFRLRADRWGARRVGLLGLRLRGPGRMSEFETIVNQQTVIKVYPAYERVSRSLPPLDTQSYAGDYASRVAGDGIEFANVRPFVSGDSIRRVNWRVTSRSNELHVNLAQPERDADVVLFLDTFGDAGLKQGTILDLTVRGAAAIARHHLRHNDRIGLVSFGGLLRWLTASMGRTHAYRIADFLIDVNATFSFAWKEIELLPHGTLPPKATVIAFSPLVDDRALKALADINRRGFPTVVINTLVEDNVEPTPGAEGELAYRAWRLQRELKRDRLKEAGIAVTDWSGDEGLEVAMSALPRRAQRRIGAHR